MADLYEAALNLVLLPALWLSVALGLTCGVLFYLWRRGGWRRFWRDLVAGVVGFALGQVLVARFGAEITLIGQVQVIPGLVGALMVLIVGRALAAR